MKALRSSPLSALALGSALQDFILSCCVCLAAERHCFMKALRSSPFLSPASALQVFILFCCAVGALSCAWAAVPKARQAPRAARERSFFMVCGLPEQWMEGGRALPAGPDSPGPGPQRPPCRIG